MCTENTHVFSGKREKNETAGEKVLVNSTKNHCILTDGVV